MKQSTCDKLASRSLFACICHKLHAQGLEKIMSMRYGMMFRYHGKGFALFHHDAVGFLGGQQLEEAAGSDMAVSQRFGPGTCLKGRVMAIMHAERQTVHIVFH
jgi:hypothetical protein